MIKRRISTPLSRPIESAHALFDGGWRASDRKELIAEHNLNSRDAHLICEILTVLEQRLSKREEETQ